MNVLWLKRLGETIQMSGVAVVGIASSAVIASQVPARKLAYMLLLLAIGDRATEVQFEPSVTDGTWKVRFQVDGVWYEMVPVPLDVPLSHEIRRLARMSGARRLLRWLTAWCSSNAARDEGRIRVVVSGKAVDVTVVVKSSRCGRHTIESVALRFPSAPVPSEEASEILREYLGSQDAQDMQAE